MNLNFDSLDVKNLFRSKDLLNNLEPMTWKPVGALKSSAVSITHRLITPKEIARLEMEQQLQQEKLTDWASVVVTDGEEPLTNKFSNQKEARYEEMKETSTANQELHTGAWLRQHAPKGSLSKLHKVERKEIGKRRPVVEYDILPLTLTSSPFIVQFDMENPRCRFLIKHRTANSSYIGLSEADKIELVRLALLFAEKFGIKDAVLKIPVLASSNISSIYGRFYAYIICPNHEIYVRLFRSYVKDQGIPFWPTTSRWVTPLWIPEAKPQADDECYIESVMLNQGMFPDKETALLSRKHFNFKNIASASVSDTRFSDFETFSWEDELLVGVRCHSFYKSSISAVDRWQFLQFMSSITQKLERQRVKLRCSLFLSLAHPFVLRKRQKVFAMMRFEDRLPKFLKSACDKDDTQVAPRRVLRDLSYTEQDVTLHEESWVLIKDVEKSPAKDDSSQGSQSGVNRGSRV